MLREAHCSVLLGGQGQDFWDRDRDRDWFLLHLCTWPVAGLNLPQATGQLHAWCGMLCPSLPHLPPHQGLSGVWLTCDDHPTCTILVWLGFRSSIHFVLCFSPSLLNIHSISLTCKLLGMGGQCDLVLLSHCGWLQSMPPSSTALPCTSLPSSFYCTSPFLTPIPCLPPPPAMPATKSDRQLMPLPLLPTPHTPPPLCSAACA